MKTHLKIFSSIFLLIYCSFVFRIIFPLIEYGLNYSYIIAELCEQRTIVENKCKGKCHLSKEINQQSNLPASDKILVVIDFLKIPHQTNELMIEWNDLHILNMFQSFFDSEVNKFSLEPPIPPPKYIS